MPSYKYQCLVTRSETFQFEVEAASADAACRKLQRDLKAAEETQGVHRGKLIFASWSEPNEPGEEWMVMRTTPAEGLKSLLVQFWDGRELSVIGEVEPNHNIEQAVRELFNPRISIKKRKSSGA